MILLISLYEVTDTYFSCDYSADVAASLGLHVRINLAENSRAVIRTNKNNGLNDIKTDMKIFVTTNVHIPM